MAGIYLDTSAIGRALLAEPEARAIRTMIADFETRWSSELLVVELRRLAAREGIEAVAEVFLDGIGLLAVDSASLDRASRVQPIVVRSLDAVHLDAALTLRDRGEIEVVMTYDRQLQAGCAHHGLDVAAPTAL